MSYSGIPAPSMMPFYDSQGSLAPCGMSQSFLSGSQNSPIIHFEKKSMTVMDAGKIASRIPPAGLTHNAAPGRCSMPRAVDRLSACCMQTGSQREMPFPGRNIAEPLPPGPRILSGSSEFQSQGNFRQSPLFMPPAVSCFPREQLTHNQRAELEQSYQYIDKLKNVAMQQEIDNLSRFMGIHPEASADWFRKRTRQDLFNPGYQFPQPSQNSYAPRNASDTFAEPKHKRAKVEQRGAQAKKQPRNKGAKSSSIPQTIPVFSSQRSESAKNSSITGQSNIVQKQPSGFPPGSLIPRSPVMAATAHQVMGAGEIMASGYPFQQGGLESVAMASKASMEQDRKGFEYKTHEEQQVSGGALTVTPCPDTALIKFPDGSRVFVGTDQQSQSLKDYGSLLEPVLSKQTPPSFKRSQSYPLGIGSQGVASSSSLPVLAQGSGGIDSDEGDGMLVICESSETRYSPISSPEQEIKK